MCRRQLRGGLRGSLRPLRMVLAARFEHTCTRCSEHRDASVSDSGWETIRTLYPKDRKCTIYTDRFISTFTMQLSKPGDKYAGTCLVKFCSWSASHEHRDPLPVLCIPVWDAPVGSSRAGDRYRGSGVPGEQGEALYQGLDRSRYPRPS